MNTATFTGIEVPQHLAIHTSGCRKQVNVGELLLRLIGEQTDLDFAAWAENLKDEAAEHGCRHVHIPGPACPGPITLELTAHEAALLEPFVSAQGHVRIVLLNRREVTRRDVRDFARPGAEPAFRLIDIDATETLEARLITIDGLTAKVELSGELEYQAY